MGIPSEARSTRHLKAFTQYHLAALKADPATAHLIEPTEKLLSATLAALDAREAAEQLELDRQALAVRRDFDLDALTRTVELHVLGAVGKDRESGGYRSAFPRGLSALVGLRGKEQENATIELTLVLRTRFAEVGERYGANLEQLAKASSEAEDAWRTAERAAKSALVEEQIARSELVRQLHSNRGALRALYPRDRRRLASYFPPSHSRAAGEPDDADNEVTTPEVAAE
jgi:hypothetical protein